MSTQNHCLFATCLILSFVLVLFLSSGVRAGGLADELQKRLEIQSAEIDLLAARVELENWKHAKLEGLYDQGFASWLEVRRQVLFIQSIQAHQNAARDFHKLLSDIETHQRSVLKKQTIVFHQRTTSPIKIFRPGSIRMIGWIEGQSLGECRARSAYQAEITAAQEKLAKAQKAVEEAKKLKSSLPGWLEKAALKLELAKTEMAYIQAVANFPAQADVAETDQAFSIDELDHVVTAEQSAELKHASLRVARAEAAAVGNINRVKIILDREQRRADAYRRLQSDGLASDSEIDAVNQRVAEIQSQLLELTDARKLLVSTAVGCENSIAVESMASYETVNNWPAIVVCDKEYVMHLINLRREYYRQQATAENARLKSNMLQEVLERLQAARQTNSGSRLDSILSEGQRNEIKNYQSDIALTRAEGTSAREQQQILIQEESRFLQQTLSQYAAARDKLANSSPVLLTPLALLNLALPAAAVVSHGNAAVPTHYSYLECENLNDTSPSSSLMLSQSNRNFIGTPCDIGSLQRISLRPVQSLSLTTDSRRMYSSARGLQVEPDWMNYFRSGLARNSYSILPYARPSLYHDFARKNYYTNYGYRSYGIYHAYPNGILRSELRSRAPVGQLPWYLPGSPGNFHSRYDYHGPRSYRH